LIFLIVPIVYFQNHILEEQTVKIPLKLFGVEPILCISPTAPVKEFPSYEEVQKYYFLSLVYQAEGDLAYAARIAKMTPRKLAYWLLKYKLKGHLHSLRPHDARITRGRSEAA
jgi:hypothetical protein